MWNDCNKLLSVLKSTAGSRLYRSSPDTHIWIYVVVLYMSNENPDSGEKTRLIESLEALEPTNVEQEVSSADHL